VDRIQLITAILMNVDSINESYINGNLDEDGWAKELMSTEHKLNVFGLSMTFRPWEGKRSTPAF
jgi:filamentous hemagglutinin family protein